MKIQTPVPIGDAPISLPDAKRQCFVTSDADDGYITQLIGAACAWAEARTWRAVRKARYKGSFDSFPIKSIEMARSPLIAIESFTYIDTDGDEIALTENVDYLIDRYSQPERLIAFERWPTAKDTPNAVKITFTAGYDGIVNTIPDDITQGLRMMVKHFYDNPEAVVVTTGGASAVDVPISSKALIDPYSLQVFV